MDGSGITVERLAAAPAITPAAEALLTTDVPLIAAVNGPAVGRGVRAFLEKRPPTYVGR